MWHLPGMPQFRSSLDAKVMWLCSILAFGKVGSNEGGGGTQWKEHRPLVNSILAPTWHLDHF